MKGWVVDVNVLIVANGSMETQSVPDHCRSSCRSVLKEIRETLKTHRAKFLLDLSADRHGQSRPSEILRQYYHYLKPFEQGVGNAFFRWVYYQAPLSIERVVIHPDNHKKYREFPDDPALAEFDWDDRVYVAVARAYAHPSEIVNAVDSDWEIFEEPLRKQGITVRNLPDCPRKERIS